MKKFPIIFIVLTLLLTSVQAKTLKDLRNLKAGFEKKYSIQLFFEEIPFSTWKIDYEVVTKEYYDELFDYMVLLDEEFSKYPITFLWRTKLRAVSLVRLLVNSANYTTAGVPDHIRKILFLDFSLATYDKNYQKHAIHHEFFHMIE